MNKKDQCHQAKKNVIRLFTIHHMMCARGLQSQTNIDT